ncbi:MAG: hypothetical protein K2H85_07485, partial [Allobaculum sp.]|nr:hypothetical protein [Allobaculum sp.]
MNDEKNVNDKTEASSSPATDRAIQEKESETLPTETIEVDILEIDKVEDVEKTKNISNEIDDFTRKLLDKQVELTLFPDDDITSSALEGTMSEAQRKNAEFSMLTALDQVRRERGQTPISEEEKRYAAREKNKENQDQSNTLKSTSDTLKTTATA